MNRMDELYDLPRGTRIERQALAVATVLSVVAAVLAGYAVAGAALLGTTAWTGCWGPSRREALALLALAAAALAAALRTSRLRPALLPASLLVLAYLAWAVGGGAAGQVCRPALYFRARPRLAAWPAARHRCDAWGLSMGSLVLACESAWLLVAARRLRSRGDTHGSAHFATDDELRRQFALAEPGEGTGILVGRSGGKNVLFAEDGHILLVAPSGGGKTTCHVVPALFDASGLAASALVLDIKGELASLTSGFRAAHGHRIIRHNPAELGEDLARYNPLWRVRPERAVQDAQLVAQDLVPATPSDPFWGVAARQFVTGLVLHILSSAEEKSLGSCYDFLTDTLPLEKRLGTMLKSDLRVVSGAARALLDMADKTRSSVLATATAALGLYADPILRAATAASDFEWEDLLSAKTTVYLTLTPDQIRRLEPHLRLMVSQLLEAITAQGPQRERKVLLVLDEFPALGKVEALAKGIAYVRGYGGQVFLVVQSLRQLTELYGRDESLSGNCRLLIAYAAADVETAEKLSRHVGNQTLNIERVSRSFGRAGGNIQTVDLARPVISPDEVLRLPSAQCLVFLSGARPARLQKVPYFSDPAFRAAAAMPAAPVVRWTRAPRWSSASAAATAPERPSGGDAPDLVELGRQLAQDAELAL